MITSEVTLEKGIEMLRRGELRLGEMQIVIAPSESAGSSKVVDAVPTGSSPSIIEIQNALRLLTRVMKRDDELIFTGGDIIVFRDHLYRTQEISAMLGSNKRI